LKFLGTDLAGFIETDFTFSGFLSAVYFLPPGFLSAVDFTSSGFLAMVFGGICRV
jgi:hypothetical protein